LWWCASTGTVRYAILPCHCTCGEGPPYARNDMNREEKSLVTGGANRSARLLRITGTVLEEAGLKRGGMQNE